MAPVPPSPHRFVSGQRRQASPVKKESLLHQEAPLNNAQHKSDVAEQRALRATASQFARTPRFAFGRASQSQQPPRSQPPQTQRLVEAFRARPTDDVEEQDGAGEEDDEMLDNGQMEALPTIEDAEELRDLPYSPKRRRYSNERMTAGASTMRASAARPVFKQPTTPASRFPMAQSDHPHIANISQEGSQVRRPAFLRSSIAPPEQHEPLPEAFSPHRRGEKFVPGGMAATLQQWVIETGQSATQSKRGKGYLQGEDYVKRCRVLSVSGKDALMVRGRESGGTEVKLLLMANSKQAHVAVGDDICIRAPIWSVQLEGCSWTVCVDWKIVQ